MAALQSTTPFIVVNGPPFIVVDGPSGTGKTSMACSHAAGLIRDKLADPRNHKLDRIVVTRPTVTAGDDIGFLPGTLENKLRPFLMPIFDCFAEFGYDERMLLDNGLSEVVPLAFMRGRTFKNCFIIADEMQNATPEQMKMVVTRLGENSRMVVTGDLAQSDLAGARTNSGLADIIKKAESAGITMTTIDDDVPPHGEYMEIIHLDQNDVVRHKAVAWLLEMLYHGI